MFIHISFNIILNHNSIYPQFICLFNLQHLSCLFHTQPLFFTFKRINIYTIILIITYNKSSTPPHTRLHYNFGLPYPYSSLHTIYSSINIATKTLSLKCNYEDLDTLGSRSPNNSHTHPKIIKIFIHILLMNVNMIQVTDSKLLEQFLRNRSSKLAFQCNFCNIYTYLH